MFYLNDNLTKQDWIRISALSNNTKKRSNNNNNNRIVVPKIEKVSLHKINTSSSSSSSSSSLFSSISSNLINNSKYIYKKRQNKSRNYLNINNINNNSSSEESLFKLEQNHKKRKQKLNKLIDNLDKSTKYNNNKSNHYEQQQQQRRHIRSRSSRDSSRLLKQQQRSTSSELYSLSHNYEKIINNNDLFKNDVLKYNSYGLIRLIPSKLTRPSLPPHCAHKYLFIVPPAKHNRAILVNAVAAPPPPAPADNPAIFTSSRSNSYNNYLNRTKRSRSSPKISVFYSVEYESPDEFTANSIVETLSKTISNTKILDENLNTIRVKTKIR
jgi:hypothetical protein